MTDQEKSNQQNVFKDEEEKRQPTMSGLEENIAGLLCYIAIIGIIFMFVEKENRFIRFHAMQAILATVTIMGLFIVLNFIPIIGLVISLLLSPLSLALVIFLMYQAYNKKMFKLPFIGDLAEQYSAPK